MNGHRIDGGFALAFAGTSALLVALSACGGDEHMAPRLLTYADLDRLTAFVSRVQEDGRFRYTSPHDLWKWKRDEGAVVVRKTSANGYILDLTAAALDHRLELDPELPQPNVTPASET